MFVLIVVRSSTCFDCAMTASTCLERQVMSRGAGDSVPSTHSTCVPFVTFHNPGPGCSPLTMTSSSPSSALAAALSESPAKHRPLTIAQAQANAARRTEQIDEPPCPRERRLSGAAPCSAYSASKKATFNAVLHVQYRLRGDMKRRAPPFLLDGPYTETKELALGFYAVRPSQRRPTGAVRRFAWPHLTPMLTLHAGQDENNSVSGLGAT